MSRKHNRLGRSRGPLILFLLVGSAAGYALAPRTALSGGGETGAAGGEVLWEERLGDWNQDSDLHLAVQGTEVLVTGSTAGNSSVRVYDVKTGDLLRHYPIDSPAISGDSRFDNPWWGSDTSPYVLSLAVGGPQLFIAGRSFLGEYGDHQFSVWAHDRQTGALLWEQIDPPYDDFLGPGGDPKHMVARENRVFVAGEEHQVGQRNGTLTWRVVRAYEATHGDLLWEDKPSGLLSGFAVQGQRVFVTGHDEDGYWYGPRYAGSIVHAYDAETGDRLWEDGFTGTPYPSDYWGCGEDVEVPCTEQWAYTRDLALGGSGVVFVIGEASNVEGGSDAFVRAYEAEMGQLLWDNTDPDFGSAYAVVAGERRVFVRFGCVVRAYWASTGERIWEARLPESSCSSFGFTGLAMRRGRVVVASGGSLRTYDARTGDLLWQKNDALDIESWHVGKQRIVVAGSVSNANGGRDFIVRAYAVRDLNPS